MERDSVIAYIRTAEPSDLLQLLDEVMEKVSGYMGLCPGIEDDRHNLLMQIQRDEEK